MHKQKNLEVQVEKPIFFESCLYRGPLEKAINTARHFGFTLIEPMTITKRLPATITKAKKVALKEKDFSDFPRDYMSTLKKYIDDELHKFAQPVLFCHVINKNNNESELRLEIVGTKKSVAEATVIKAAHSILEELGHTDICVRLNTIGDKESGNVFLRELTSYYREHMTSFSPTLQQQIKKDILKIYSNTSEKYRDINVGAPKPINFLTEESRVHFAEILDFLENLEINYEIGDDLVGTSSCFPKTLYEIVERRENSEGVRALASGERYNYLAQNIGFNKKLPIVGIAIKIQRKGKQKDKYLKNAPESPKIYFIHLGPDAKKRGLRILDIFKKSGIRAHQSLCHDSFTTQLRMAQTAGVPYTMIMGQKEVIENSIIFRDTETRYQEIIALPDLEDFLKNLQKRRAL